MKKIEIATAIAGLNPEELIKFISTRIELSNFEGYKQGFKEGVEETEVKFNTEEEINPEEDSEGAIAFALNQLKEAKERGVSIDELIRDLTIRSCRFMPNTILSNISQLTI